MGKFFYKLKFKEPIFTLLFPLLISLSLPDFSFGVQGDTCEEPILANMGDDNYADNLYFNNTVTYYNCSSWNESGGDVFFSVPYLCGTLYTWFVQVNQNLDIFILDGCPAASHCVAYGDNSATYRPAKRKDVIVAVDGRNGAHSAFQLYINVVPHYYPDRCELALPITSGTISGNTVGECATTDIYGCLGLSFPGNEDWYTFSLPSFANFSAVLTHNPAQQFLVLLDYCDIIDGCHGISRSMSAVLPAGTYFLVVDGTSPGGGEYSFEISLATHTPTATPTPTPTNTPTASPTDTPTLTPTDTPSSTPTFTPTLTPTATSTPTSTPTPTYQNVCGHINSDTTWTRTQMNYQVVCDLFVDVNATLTILEGVNVHFNGKYSINISGRLRAFGSPDLPVIFSTNLPQPTPGSWGFLNFTATSGRAIEGKSPKETGNILSHCIIEYGSGITSRSPSLYLENCLLQYNQNALSGGAVYINQGNAVISDTTFYRNSSLSGGSLGLWNESQATLSGNTFAINSATDNGGAIYAKNSRLVLDGNQICRNLTQALGGGLYAYNCFLEITYNTFANNSAYLGNELYLALDSNVSLLEYNNIVNDFNQILLYNDTIKNIYATNNYWGPRITNAESLIFDKEDNPSLGRVYTSPLLSAPHPDAPPPAPLRFFVWMFGHEIVATWDTVGGSDIIGYNIYYDTDSSSPPYEGKGFLEGDSPIWVGNTSYAVLHNPGQIKRHYFAATSKDLEGNESFYSKVVIATSQPSFTPTMTPTYTGTPSPTPTATPTETATATSSPTPTNTPTLSPSCTPTDTLTPSPTQTPMDTPTLTPTETPTLSPTFTPSITPTDTPTGTATNSPTETPTLTPTDTPTPAAPAIAIRALLQGYYRPASGTQASTAIDLELRAGQSPPQATTIVASYADLPTDEYGQTPEVILEGLMEGDYFLVVRHFNHLAVISNQQLHFQLGETSYADLSDPGSPHFVACYGAMPLAVETDGRLSLWSGNANADRFVNVQDFVLWRLANGSNPQSPNWNLACDFDYNNFINVADFFIWRMANGRASYVP